MSVTLVQVLLVFAILMTATTRFPAPVAETVMLTVVAVPTESTASADAWTNANAMAYALATQRHFELAAFHTSPTSSRFVLTVVEGSVTVDDSNEDPQVIALAAVPVMAIQSV